MFNVLQRNSKLKKNTAMSVKQASKDYQKNLDDLIKVYKDWLENRRKTIKSLKEIVNDMDSKEFKSNVTSIVGSGVGVTGGAMVLAGLLLTPFTGGLGLVLAGVGAGVGAAGGVTNLTGDAISKNYALRRCKEAEDEIRDDQQKSADLEHAEATLTKAIVILKKEADATKTDISTIMKTASVTAKGMKVLKIVHKTVGFAKVGYKGVGAFGMAAGKAIGKASGALAVVGIGFDIWTIVSSSKDISNGSKSELGKGITKHILELEKSLNAVEKYFSETYEFNY